MLPNSNNHVFVFLPYSPDHIHIFGLAMIRKVDLPSSSLKVGVTSVVAPSFSELNTSVVRPHFHSTSNRVHCSRTPTCAGKDETKQWSPQFHSAKGICILDNFTN